MCGSVGGYMRVYERVCESVWEGMLKVEREGFKT